MIEMLLLAFALSMDAFAVAIGLGAKKNGESTYLAFKVGLFFGSFQALMPLVGYLGGMGLSGFFEHYTRYIAFGLLLLIGAKMIYDGMNEGIGEEISRVTNKVLLMLAIATSIDAMAAGFSLMHIAFNPLLACALIGFITFIMSLIGFYIGKLTGTWLESKAEIFGGIVLAAIGFRILFF